MAKCMDVILFLVDGANFVHVRNHTEKEEKEYEAAAAKGYRPCPTCKKLVDLSSRAVFKSCAFEPSDEELRNTKRLAKSITKKPTEGTLQELSSDDDAPTNVRDSRKSKGGKLRRPGDLPELSDSSDDEMPDVRSIIAGPSPKKPTGKKREMEPDSDEEEEPRKSGKRARVTMDDEVGHYIVTLRYRPLNTNAARNGYYHGRRVACFAKSDLLAIYRNDDHVEQG
jgi:hypothetical protein